MRLAISNRLRNLVLYLTHRCFRCRAKIPKGTGWTAYAFLNRLCDSCWQVIHS